MTRSAPKWALCIAPNTSAALTLYCFPHSGGSPGEYMRWSGRLPLAEVWGVQLPGRGARLAEPPYTSMPELIVAMAAETEFVPPFAFFGHSLGALIAYEAAAVLDDLGLPGPEAVMLSASAAPHLVKSGPPIHTLSGPELVHAVEELYGPLPIPLDDDANLREQLLKGLRADLEIVHRYTAADRDPLRCPVTVFAGAQDEYAESELSAWNGHTAGAFELRMFRGGHFYFREHPDDFFPVLAAALEKSAARALFG